MHLRITGLWRHADFMKLWSGETVSLLGSQVTFLALPLMAAVTLHAGPAEMGLLGAVQYLPFLAIGLFAGVWVDRVRRRPLLIGTDIGRALLLASIPLAAALGGLTFLHLYLVAALTGLLSVFFEVAYLAYLPALVQRQHLLEGNAKLEISRSVAQVGGPSLAGVLVQLITAPFAVALDAGSFIVSAVCLGAIRTPEPPPRPTADRRGVWSEIGEGLRSVAGSALLRALAGATGTMNFFGNIFSAVFILYALRELHASASVLGLVFAAMGAGALLGAFSAARLARRFGLGRTLIGAIILASPLRLLVPALSDASLFPVLALIAAWAVMGFTGPVYNVNQVTLRQALTPDHLQGRMNATMRFIVYGTIPLGALVGGALGETLGLRPTLIIGTLGQSLAVLWLLFSPVRTLHQQPAATRPQQAVPA